MSASMLNATVTGWWSCQRPLQCHKKVKNDGPVTCVLPITTSGGGWVLHTKNEHQCSNGGSCHQGAEKAHSTRAEFLRSAGRLASKNKGGVQDNLKKQFRDVWTKVYPNVDVPLVDKDFPPDLWDDPLFAPFVCGTGSSAAPPCPDTPVPTEAVRHPSLHSSDNPPALHSTPPSGMPGGGQLTEYLRQHNFKITIRPMYSCIQDNSFPGFNPPVPNPNPQIVHVVFVENPENQIPDSSTPWSFLSQTSLDRDIFDRFAEAMPKCIKEIPEEREETKTDGKVNCIISSWLLLAAEMMDRLSAWSVTLMSWPNFLEVVTNRNDRRWTLLMNHTDLIVGGLDFESDFLNPDAAFHVDLDQAVQYLEGMRVLLKKEALWPSPEESLLSSQKLETHRILGACAAALDFQHPLIALVEDHDLDAVFQSIMDKMRDAVLKRDYSGWSRHIITPHSNFEEAEQMIYECRAQLETHWDIPENPFPRPEWYLQPYLPHLMHLGEFRAFFVGGVYYYAVATTPENYDPGLTANTAATFKRPLSAFLFDPGNPTDPDVTGWLTLDGNSQPHPSAFDNDSSFEMFALKMLGKLILAEEHESGQLSSLRIFARLDISIYRDNSRNQSRFQYVLSEVNRTLSTALYSSYAEPIGTWDGMIVHLAGILHQAVTDKWLLGTPPPPPPPGL